MLYNQIAEADERHLAIIAPIATRSGHTPTPAGTAGGDQHDASDLAQGQGDRRLGSAAHEPGVGHDLAAKANAIHWYSAWVHAFEEIGDTESARELAAILTEEKSHRDALQVGLNRLLSLGAGAAAEVAGAGK